MERGYTPWWSTSHAILVVMTRVFPEPAPARISKGAPVWITASRCAGFKVRRYSGSARSVPSPGRSSLIHGPFQLPAVSAVYAHGHARAGRDGAPHHNQAVHVRG